MNCVRGLSAGLNSDLWTVGGKRRAERRRRNLSLSISHPSRGAAVPRCTLYCFDPPLTLARIIYSVFVKWLVLIFFFFLYKITVMKSLLMATVYTTIRVSSFRVFAVTRSGLYTHTHTHENSFIAVIECRKIIEAYCVSPLTLQWIDDENNDFFFFLKVLRFLLMRFFAQASRNWIGQLLQSKRTPLDFSQRQRDFL